MLSLIGLVISLNAAFQCAFELTQDGYDTFLKFCVKYSHLYASTFLAISVYIATISLINKKEIDEGKTLLDIKLLLENYNDIHLKFRGETGEWIRKVPEIKDKAKSIEIWAKIDAYLGTFELCGILVDKGTISLANFNSQFGYKLRNILSVENVRSRINYERSSWSELIKLATKMNIPID